MTRHLQAEWVKLRSTRTAAFLLLATLLLVALAISVHVLAPAAANLGKRNHQLEVLEVSTRLGILFAAVAGAMAITAEFHFGTIRPTFLVSPQRSLVVAAKLAVSGAVGFAIGAFAEGLGTGVAIVGLELRGIPLGVGAGDYVRLIAGGALGATLWSMIGLGVGALLRNQVPTLVGLCAWVLLVENVVALSPATSRFLPGASTLALAGESGAGFLPVAGSAVVLLSYTVSLVGAGWLAVIRRDAA